MKELVVISGKGGTGKTSLVACFAALASKKVLADCDVDAADLHLVLEPRIERNEVFQAGKKAAINAEQCTACGHCQELCAFQVISLDGASNSSVPATYRIDPVACEGCGLCYHFCPAGAVSFEPADTGRWFVSDTRFGHLVHARLHPGEENSGKLVTKVRSQARQLAETHGLDLVIIDGPPGIGCPVIASLAGTSLALVVTEPTLSGIHDLVRVRKLTMHFDIPTLVCINKYDINLELTERIESQGKELDMEVVARLPYDPAVTEAQIQKLSVVEFTHNPIADQIRALWEAVFSSLEVHAESTS